MTQKSESLPEKTEKADDQERKRLLVELARKRFAGAQAFHSENRREMKRDFEFVAGDQWDPEIKALREADKRPMLVINRIAASVHQITNAQRQSKPAIKVSPVDSKADPKTAKVRQGGIRHIEYRSDAPTAYNNGLYCAAVGGEGFWELTTRYKSPTSFDIEAVIEPVYDPFTVLIDPLSKKGTAEDAGYYFIEYEFSKEEFEDTWPDAEISSNNWSEYESVSEGWVQVDKVRVCKYVYRDHKEVTVFLLSNEETVEETELPETLQLVNMETGEIYPEGTTEVEGESAWGFHNGTEWLFIVEKRKVKKPIVRVAKIDGVGVLEEGELPGTGQLLPIVRCVGEDIWFAGKRITQGIVRQSRDPQKMYNYQATNEAEVIALMPKAPWIIEVGQIQGHEKLWAEANSKSYPYLPYNGKSVNNTLVPPPQRLIQEPAVGAITNSRVMAGEDLQYTSGHHRAALGATSNEVSGRAIQSRVGQAETANFHFVDNMGKGICLTGRILNDWFPALFPKAELMRVLGEEGEEDLVPINQKTKHKGELVHYQMDVGIYDVTVSMGPSFETKRQEAAAHMIEFIGKLPPEAQHACMDLIAKYQDWPGAQEISERLKKIVPPGIIEDKENKPLPPEVQQQMMQMQDMIKRLSGVTEEQAQIIEQKRLELESRERIENQKNQTTLLVEQLKAGSKEALELFKQELAQLEQRMALLREGQPINPDFNGGDVPMQGAPSNVQQAPGGPSPSESMGVEP